MITDTAAGSGFQTAVTRLLRMPETTRAHLQEVTDELGLSGGQARQLRSLAADPLVLKYAQLMRLLRRDSALQALPVAREQLGDKALSDLYLDWFEPTAALVRQDDLSPRFVAFLAALPADAPALESLPEHARDLFRYELAALTIERARRRDRKAPRGSRLKHTAFLVIDLDHDLTQLLKHAREGTVAALTEYRRPTKLLFVKGEARRAPRLFKIDAPLQEFLERGGQGAKPPAYAALVGIGLCRPERADEA